jgi:hypothetical protein
MFFGQEVATEVAVEEMLAGAGRTGSGTRELRGRACPCLPRYLEAAYLVEEQELDGVREGLYLDEGLRPFRAAEVAELTTLQAPTRP